jgi:hypothetical protein
LVVAWSVRITLDGATVDVASSVRITLGEATSMWRHPPADEALPTARFEPVNVFPQLSTE